MQRQFKGRERWATDSTGCGDMTLAALGVCLAGGLDWHEAAIVANAAAGLKVEWRGAVPVHRSEVVLDLCHGRKLIPAELLPAVRDAATARGKRIAFTNGCFDIVHPAHVSTLNEARAQADMLVVGLNGDGSVRGLKGPGRPIHNLTERAFVLGSLSAVDYIVAFDEPTPEALICSLRPDVLVKGGDYTKDKVVGAYFVESSGGRVHLSQYLPGHSTSRLVGL